MSRAAIVATYVQEDWDLGYCTECITSQWLRLRIKKALSILDFEVWIQKFKKT